MTIGAEDLSEVGEKQTQNVVHLGHRPHRRASVLDRVVCLQRHAGQHVMDRIQQAGEEALRPDERYGAAPAYK